MTDNISTSRSHDDARHTGWRRAISIAALLAAAPLLGGCNYIVLDPQGPIGADEKSLIILSTCLMLIVIVPVMAMILGFSWRYRASNTRATYAPEWDHSNKIELVVWAIPCLIIVVLATVTWISSHRLDPYKPVAGTGEPLDVEVVSLDWKWLFIYPKQKIATVNELAIPVDAPVHFRLTSATVMNSFFIPQLGSQIYTMAGMQTQLGLVASKPGDYLGISANYSGDGFSDMTFHTLAMSRADFDAWVKKVRTSPQKLTLDSYKTLAAPSEKVPVTYYGAVDGTVFHNVLNKCTDGSTCTDDAMKLTMAKNMSHGTVGLCRVPSAKVED